MKVIYQGIECLSGEMNRSPGLYPGRGHVLIRRELITALKVKHSPAGVVLAKNQLWPAGNREGTLETIQPGAPSANAVNGVLNFFGDLVFDSSDEDGGTDKNVRVFSHIYLDRSAIEEEDVDAYDESGKISVVRVNLIDSRHLWAIMGEFSGRFNVITASGTPDITSLKGGTERWSYLDLLERAVDGLGNSPIITFRHTDLGEVQAPSGLEYHFEPTLNVVRQLLDFGGFVIGLHDDDTIGIYRPNVGHTELTFRSIDDNSTFTVGREFCEDMRGTVSWHPRPALVRVVGAFRRQNMSCSMIPVFTDRRGKLRPLNDEALNQAGMTIAGAPATVAILVQWITGRPQNAPIISVEDEERLLDEAFRLYMISSAATTEAKPLFSWDFSKTPHPFLPMKARVQPPDEDHLQPFETAPRVYAMRYRQRMFDSAATLAEALAKYSESLDVAIDDAKFRRDAAKFRLTENIAKQNKVVAAIAENLANTIETPSAELPEETQLTIKLSQELGILNTAGAELIASPFYHSDTAQSSSLQPQGLWAALGIEMEMINLEVAEWDDFIARREKTKLLIQTAQSAVIGSVGFREFFKMHFSLGHFLVPEGMYQLIPDKGIVRFQEPLFVINSLVAQDLDSTFSLDPRDAGVRIQFSYDLHRGAMHDRVSWLFAPNPEDLGAPKFGGKNADCDLPPMPIRNENLREYLDENGASVSDEYDSKMQTAASFNAAPLLSVERTRQGFNYRLFHFWKVDAIPPVSSLVIGTEGENPRTFVAVNSPEEAILGYPSQRRNETRTADSISDLARIFPENEPLEK